MNKASIKVIKRKNMEAQNACEPNTVETPEKTERRSQREIVNTVANWIAERRENSRIEEVTAIRQIFGGEPLLSKA